MRPAHSKLLTIDSSDLSASLPLVEFQSEYILAAYSAASLFGSFRVLFVVYSRLMVHNAAARDQGRPASSSGRSSANSKKPSSWRVPHISGYLTGQGTRASHP
jgi:hypothetical protein